MRPAPCQAPEPPEAAEAKQTPELAPHTASKQNQRSTPSKMSDYSR